MIHSTAIIHEKARLGKNIKIGPYCIVGENVSMGDDCTLHAHVILSGKTTIGKKNEFYPFANIGEVPQDLTYKNEPTEVIIGNGNIFREYVSIHRGTSKDKKVTTVGDSNLLMSYVHLGHDVTMGSHCIVANSTNFAGHVNVGDKVIIGGGTNISQFVSLGRGAYIGGASAIDRDIPPFCTAYGNRARLKGINIVGLRRLGEDKGDISEVVNFFRLMESSAFAPRAFVEQDSTTGEFQKNNVIGELIDFIKVSKIGVAPFMS